MKVQNSCKGSKQKAGEKMGEVIVSMKDIVKTFPGVKALDLSLIHIFWREHLLRRLQRKIVHGEFLLQTISVRIIAVRDYFLMKSWITPKPEENNE